MPATRINGVIIFVENDLYAPLDPQEGEKAVVFGQLTSGGVPVDESEFALGANFMNSHQFGGEECATDVSLDRKTTIGGTGTFSAICHRFGGNGIAADGVQIHYVVRSSGILGFDINGRDLSSNPDEDVPEEVRTNLGLLPDAKMNRFLLAELPVDPPGEAHVAFF